MNPIHALCAFAAGALTMYYLDPQQGRRRRALVRDQLVHARTVARREGQGRASDLMNRAEGVVAETRSTLAGAREKAL